MRSQKDSQGCAGLVITPYWGLLLKWKSIAAESE